MLGDEDVVATVAVNDLETWFKDPDGNILSLVIG
jgi:hypothetical protein